MTDYVWCCDEDCNGIFTFEVYDTRVYFPPDDDIEGFGAKHKTVFMLEECE